MTDPDTTQKSQVLCKHCCHPIPHGARICSICRSYQNWFSFIPFSSTILALLTALISVMGIVIPLLYGIFHTPQSEASLTMPSIDGTTLRVTAVNTGDASASLIRAWVSSDLLAGATKVKLRNDDDALLPPGHKLLVFDIIPLLDEQSSYQHSLEMMSYITQNKPGPSTKIRFHVLQSDGRFAIQEFALSADDLFKLFRANADRCSAIEKVNFENGCIGAGVPAEEP